MEGNQQLMLFSAGELNGLKILSDQRSNTLQMDSGYLQRWKAQIFKRQQVLRLSKPIEQGTLFYLASPTTDLETIDPLALTIHSLSFYRLPADGSGDACIYFVLDTFAQVVLYIGETCRSNKRWKGQHDCKMYIDNYQSLHYQYGLKTAINMAFWWDAPASKQPRQQMESKLIAKWKSPFNKENWALWGTPFVR